MKKLLLLTASALFISATSLNAQNYEWAFGTDTKNFPVAAGYAEETTVENLVITPGGETPGTIANMGQVDASKKSFDGVTYTNRFKFNGAGYAGAKLADTEPAVFLPTQRYLSFKVEGNVTVEALAISGKTGEARAIFVTDGEKLIGSMVLSTENDISKYTVTYTGGAATLYLYCNQSNNLYSLKVTSTGGSGIEDVVADKGEVVSVLYFDLTGKQVDAETSGILIKKEVYENGSVEISKSLNN